MRRADGLGGAGTLLYKEVLRFWKVSFQTVAAPVILPSKVFSMTRWRPGRNSAGS